VVLVPRWWHCGVGAVPLVVCWKVLKIDPRTDAVSLIGGPFPGRQKWYGGLLGANGCIYGIPQCAEGVRDSRQSFSVSNVWVIRGTPQCAESVRDFTAPLSVSNVCVIHGTPQCAKSVGDSQQSPSVPKV
jgi:hypothetical protein